MTVLLRTALRRFLRDRRFTIFTSMPGSGFPTVSARKGLKSFTVITGAGFRAAVSVSHRNAEIVKKLQRAKAR